MDGGAWTEADCALPGHVHLDAYDRNLVGSEPACRLCLAFVLAPMAKRRSVRKTGKGKGTPEKRSFVENRRCVPRTARWIGTQPQMGESSRGLTLR
jgi:hypothetical protein